MSVSITHEEGSVIFTNSDKARLYFVSDKDMPSVGTLSTEGTWYVSKHGVDEFIAVLISIRQMLDVKS